MLGKRKFILAGALVLVLLVAGIGSAVVMAQGPTPTPTTPSTQSGAQTLNDLFWQSLAQKLGTTVEKIRQAITDARLDSINQGVKQGILTQPQADALLQRYQNALPGTLFGNRGLAGQLGSAYSAVANAAFDAAAKALGMTTADLTTALQSKTLLDLAREKNVDVTKLRTAIADAEKAAVDQAVKDGKLTQAQADTIKANIKPENIDLNQRYRGVGPRNGLGGLDRFDDFDRFGGRAPQVPGGRGRR